MQRLLRSLAEKIWLTFGRWVPFWELLPWYTKIIPMTLIPHGLKIHSAGSFFMRCMYMCIYLDLFSVYLKQHTNIIIYYSIDHYVKLRDIQTVAMLCCAFGVKCDSQETFRRKTTRSESGSVSVEAYFNFLTWNLAFWNLVSRLIALEPISKVLRLIVKKVIVGLAFLSVFWSLNLFLF